MTLNEIAMWCIRAGNEDQAKELFLKDGYIALGWPDVGDLVHTTAERSVFKTLISENYAEQYEDRPGAIPQAAGQLFRFVHEVKIGDFVVYPSKDHRIHLGQVTGEYKFQAKLSEKYPHTRKVKWLADRARSDFGLNALHEIGSTLSLFRVSNAYEEFFAAAEGKSTSTQKIDSEVTADIAEQAEQTTRDFVRLKLVSQLKGHALEGLVADLMRAMGYFATVTKKSGDDGVDVIAHRDELGIQPPTIKIQVKISEGPAEVPKIRDLYGATNQTEMAMFVTLGDFTKKGLEFARSKPNIRLVGGEEFIGLLLKHYEGLSPQYRGVFPLRQVWMPATTDSVDDS